LLRMISAIIPSHLCIIYIGMWSFCVRSAVCANFCAMSAALAPSACHQGRDRYAHQVSQPPHAPSPCLITTHNPYETNQNVVVEPFKRRILGCMRKQGCSVGGWQAHVSRFSRHPKSCTPCFHTSRAPSVATCGNSWQTWLGPGRVVGAIA
jgi:hypothetical protein